ncbi:nuclear transport factor 2 family protein [Vibrio neptunius]|uniref:Nuclear transport factor 2 family protein n=1 Tax=Vibrio neptunius TaxID=170651 RepID=A0ABS3A9I3_9VIBR|nr:nuclear transport factor 2 family protein [Vibrio neptunius]MBN3495715.1 nuclear transport factor 2 family protein [Vibrio neptunius]MBN3518193.1 nuclear transport factor 2 family protein [Vibrio neptunius]MBN3552489.1 nuclear transport factor 2 family protein [Vibrio neptunius]MBN3580599.1 nuclear transport factor 2 family protein [Vibrio neptunius]MCH9874265.1 nuclear transport factor 2 family protein [Vibrio neptunius]
MTTYRNFVRTLYNVVDAKDTQALAELLHPDVSFVFSNSDPIKGIENVLAINAQFFTTIHSMTHSFYGIYEDGDDLMCDGQVSYIRLDGTPYKANFATVLRLQDGLIREYKIYADLSEL